MWKLASVALLRITYTTLLFFCAVLSPWWILLLGASLGAFFFKRYFELCFVGLLFDILYGLPAREGYILHTLYYTMPITVLSVFFYVSIEELKKTLAFY